MGADVIPIDIRNFLTQHIDSIAELEALLLLRASPHENWGAMTIAACRAGTAAPRSFDVECHLIGMRRMSCGDVRLTALNQLDRVFACRERDHLLRFTVHQVDVVSIHRDHFSGRRQRCVDYKMQVRPVLISGSAGWRGAGFAIADADRHRTDDRRTVFRLQDDWNTTSRGLRQSDAR